VSIGMIVAFIRADIVSTACESKVNASLAEQHGGHGQALAYKGLLRRIRVFEWFPRLLSWPWLAVLHDDNLFD
jgi:hypothetical protein